MDHTYPSPSPSLLPSLLPLLPPSLLPSLLPPLPPFPPPPLSLSICSIPRSIGIFSFTPHPDLIKDVVAPSSLKVAPTNHRRAIVISEDRRSMFVTSDGGERWIRVSLPSRDFDESEDIHFSSVSADHLVLVAGTEVSIAILSPPHLPPHPAPLTLLSSLHPSLLPHFAPLPPHSVLLTPPSPLPHPSLPPPPSLLPPCLALLHSQCW